MISSFREGAVEFEWDAAKAKKNRQKHGLGFEIAKSVFNDPLTVTFPDPTHSEMEERRITIGASDTGQILLIVHTDREDRIRIISARRATTKERRHYEG